MEKKKKWMNPLDESAPFIENPSVISKTTLDISLLANLHSEAQTMSRNDRKRTIGHVRPAKTQIDLRIFAI